ncbi:FHA domain-containing protein [Glycine soja]
MEEQEEEAPTLRLEILQGPRGGETLEFKPGAAVRIGRVVKGNTLPIKDLGISSKHLTISTESNKWTLRDLDSSNGTVLDGSQIPPHTPFTLQHDSIIKIGELTSIHVIFAPREQQQQQVLAVLPRRNPTRRGRTEPAPTESVPPRGRGRPRGLKSKVQIQIQSVEENDASVVDAESERVGPPSRVTRKTNRGRSVVKEDWSVVVENLDAPEGKTQSVEEKNASVVEAEGEGVGPPARVTRKVNRGRSVVRVCDDDDVPVEKVEEPKSTRNLSLIVISDSSVGNSDAPLVEEPKKTRMMRNSKKVPGVTTGNVEKKTKRGVAEKRELEEEGEDLNGVKETCDGRKEGNLPNLKRRRRGATEKRELEKEGEDGNVVKEACDGREEGNLNGDDRNWHDLKGRERELEKEGVDGNSVKEACHENWPDLNKMTLGEWFDFLEVYMPKQIIDETEEMIDLMTQKAERLREYIVEMQQQNGKAKMPMEE